MFSTWYGWDSTSSFRSILPKMMAIRAFHNQIVTKGVQSAWCAGLTGFRRVCVTLQSLRTTVKRACLCILRRTTCTRNARARHQSTNDVSHSGIFHAEHEVLDTFFDRIRDLRDCKACYPVNPVNPVKKKCQLGNETCPHSPHAEAAISLEWRE